MLKVKYFGRSFIVIECAGIYFFASTSAAYVNTYTTEVFFMRILTIQHGTTLNGGLVILKHRWCFGFALVNEIRQHECGHFMLIFYARIVPTESVRSCWHQRGSSRTTLKLNFNKIERYFINIINNYSIRFWSCGRKGVALDLLTTI